MLKIPPYSYKIGFSEAIISLFCGEKERKEVCDPNPLSSRSYEFYLINLIRHSVVVVGLCLFTRLPGRLTCVEFDLLTKEQRERDACLENIIIIILVLRRDRDIKRFSTFNEFFFDFRLIR